MLPTPSTNSRTERGCRRAPARKTAFARSRLLPNRVVYADVITFPAVKQDLAFSVDESVAAARAAAGPELHDLRIFDVYRGEQVEEGKKSIALAAIFQSPERTLSDEDAASIRERSWPNSQPASAWSFARRSF